MNFIRPPIPIATKDNQSSFASAWMMRYGGTVDNARKVHMLALFHGQEKFDRIPCKGVKW